MGWSSSIRTISLLLAVLILLPLASALAISLHTSHHHASPVSPELALIAVHGHHHGASAPHHEHRANHDKAPYPPPEKAAAVSLTPSPRGVVANSLLQPTSPPRHRPPPGPLLSALCSLLL